MAPDQMAANQMAATAVASSYAPVDAARLSSILAGLPEVKARLGGEPAKWRVREVGDGNLNLVFIVEGPAGGLVVKQALPYVRLVGESWPLPLERSWFEYNALVEQARYAPRLVPKIFHFDRQQAMIVMEYLSPHVIMRKGLIRGIEYPRFAADIAEFLAETLFNTSVLAATAAEHKRRLELFARNVELCRITEGLVFTDPIARRRSTAGPVRISTPTSARSRPNSFLKAAAQARKYQFLTDAQALIHGDLHTGSIMLTAEETRVIDAEFAFVGPMGFDVGAVIGNLLLAYFAQEGHEASPARATPIAPGYSIRWWRFGLDFTTASWRSRQAKTGGLVSRACSRHRRTKRRSRRSAGGLRALFADTLAFGGLKMIRRIFGLAHVEDLESIADPARRAICERKALELARALVVDAAKFSGVADVVEAAKRAMIRSS